MTMVDKAIRGWSWLPASTALAAVVFTLALVACSSGDRGPATVGAPEPAVGQTDGVPPTGEAAPVAAAAGQVVVYTSVDRNFSEPVFTAYEAATGVKVLPVYDLEAAKTTGLVSRLMAEQPRPQADVWWNGEFAQTLELAASGALAPYESGYASGIPAAYRDPDGLWTGFGGRARVFLVNTDLVPAGEEPDSIRDMAAAPVPDEVGIASPVFGTAATQAGALYAAWGREEALKFYKAIADSGVQVLDGNGVVRDMVADGRLSWGLTDTDDACGAIERGSPVKVVFPDQGADQDGALIIPNTVGLIAGAPHPADGKALIDYLLSEQTTTDLVKAGWFQVTLRPIATEEACLDAQNVKGMSVPLTEIGSQFAAAAEDLTGLFIAP